MISTTTLDATGDGDGNLSTTGCFVSVTMRAISRQFAAKGYQWKPPTADRGAAWIRGRRSRKAPVAFLPGFRSDMTGALRPP